MSRPKKVYWDSCAWLGLLNKETDKYRELDSVWQEAENGEVEIWTSTLSQIEVCKLREENHALSQKTKLESLTKENLKKIENVFKQPFVNLISLDTEISSMSRRIFRETIGLKKASDAVHLVSAMNGTYQ